VPLIRFSWHERPASSRILRDLIGRWIAPRTKATPCSQIGQTQDRAGGPAPWAAIWQSSPPPRWFLEGLPGASAALTPCAIQANRSGRCRPQGSCCLWPGDRPNPAKSVEVGWGVHRPWPPADWAHLGPGNPCEARRPWRFRAQVDPFGKDFGPHPITFFRLPKQLRCHRDRCWV